MLRTTLNINLDVLSAVTAAAKRLNISRRSIIAGLLMRVMRDIDRFQGEFTLVKYQPWDPEGRWHCFPITFGEDENEFFTDLRKLSKFSVSYLVAIAVKEYLPEMLDEPGGKRHNYAYSFHWALGKKTAHGMVCWEIYWGDPPPPMEPAQKDSILRRTSTSRSPLPRSAGHTLH